MDKPKTTPKDFFLWAAAMLALYIGVYNFVALLWDYINYAYPDPLAYYPADPYQSGISWEMATLIVMTPLFLVLMYYIHKDIKRDPTREDIWVRRWALYFTLFVAGFSMAIDLIYVLYAFLNGSDITTEFLLKALIVLLIAALGFMHFIADLWGYWKIYPGRNRYISIGTALLVVFSIVAGFFIVGTPQQARLYRLDAQKISDLQQIQSDVVNYYQRTGKLPDSMLALNDPVAGNVVPTDPQSPADIYTYAPAGKLSFNLCATFNADSRGINLQPTAPVPYGGGASETWQHGSGYACYLRTIDPTLYPTVKPVPTP